MARRSTGFGNYKPPKAQVPRKMGIEQQLGQAIRSRVLVELRYDDDAAYRLIAPYVVFETETGSICLSCFQIINPGEPMDANEPRNFTVGKIVDLRLTGRPFTLDPRFNRYDPKYRRRVLYSV